jgi:hypothetical protein
MGRITTGLIAGVGLPVAMLLLIVGDSTISSSVIGALTGRFARNSVNGVAPTRRTPRRTCRIMWAFRRFPGASSSKNYHALPSRSSWQTRIFHRRRRRKTSYQVPANRAIFCGNGVDTTSVGHVVEEAVLTLSALNADLKSGNINEPRGQPRFRAGRCNVVYGDNLVHDALTPTSDRCSRVQRVKAADISSVRCPYSMVGGVGAGGCGRRGRVIGSGYWQLLRYYSARRPDVVDKGGLGRRLAVQRPQEIGP